MPSQNMSQLAIWPAKQGSQQLLWGLGLGHLALGLILGVASLFGTDQILGLNQWIKPLKFALSIAIYAFTLYWFFPLSNLSARTKNRLALFTTGCMLVEIGIIVAQAGRRQPSHFNISSPVNGILFSVMGLFIMLNTAVIAYLFYRFIRQRSIPGYPPALLWSIRLGLFIFLLACAEGGWIVRHLAHTVGAADGGPGLPLLNWSTRAGDLRVSHFLGLHALQVIPLITWGLLKINRPPTVRQVWLLGGAYLLLCLTLLITAMKGLPLIPR